MKEMTTYREFLNDRIYQYYYDYHIKLWTVYVIDLAGNRLSEEAEHFGDKKQMLGVYNFTFKKLIKL